VLILRIVTDLGTGIPLSLFCHSYYTALLFVLLANPAICFCGAVNKVRPYSCHDNSIYTQDTLCIRTHI
jgi:hypothetical protein